MGEVAPLYGVDPALVLTNPGVQQCNLRHKPSTSSHTRLSMRSVWLHPTRGGPVSTEHGGSKGVNPEKKSLSLRCKQPCQRTPEASEVEGLKPWMVNSGHLANPVSQSLTVASEALLQRTISSLTTRGTVMKKQNNHRNPKSTNKKQLFLKTRNGNIRSTGQQCTPKAEDGYWNEATQSGPLIHSQSHQAQTTAEHTEVNQREAWTKEEIRKVIWCYMYCKQYFTENYKTLYEIWRQWNPTCRM